MKRMPHQLQVTNNATIGSQSHRGGCMTSTTGGQRTSNKRFRSVFNIGCTSGQDKPRCCGLALRFPVQGKQSNCAPWPCYCCCNKRDFILHRLLKRTLAAGHVEKWLTPRCDFSMQRVLKLCTQPISCLRKKSKCTAKCNFKLLVSLLENSLWTLPLVWIRILTFRVSPSDTGGIR